MPQYETNTYGDLVAGVYDAWVSRPAEGSTQVAVDFLADLADGGPALELGIGTGRVALPLADRGLVVHGIDASEAMIARLREKPGGADLRIELGDFADVGLAGPYRLIFVVFNTFFALLTQAEQVRCFRNAATRLSPDGRFVIEAFVPDPSLFDRGQRVSATRVEVDRLQLDVTRHDPVAQQLVTQHVLIGREGLVLLPVQLRYAWPSELDLMAGLAGLRLEARYGGWQREPFVATSPAHVSVYCRSTASG